MLARAHGSLSLDCSDPTVFVFLEAHFLEHISTPVAAILRRRGGANGSSLQVVSIDDDKNAPASALTPRTWTFIDRRWQFDN
jgi:hypothetical protein